MNHLEQDCISQYNVLIGSALSLNLLIFYVQKMLSADCCMYSKMCSKIILSWKPSLLDNAILYQNLMCWLKSMMVAPFIEMNIVKPVLSSQSKIDKTNILKANGSLMKVKSIAECSKGSILQYF